MSNNKLIEERKKSLNYLKLIKKYIPPKFKKNKTTIHFIF